MFIKINDDYYNTRYIESILNCSECDSKGNIIKRTKVCISGWNWADCPVIEDKTPDEVLDDIFDHDFELWK